MIAYVLTVLLLVSLSSGWAVAVMALFFATHIFLTSVFVELTISQYFVLFGFVLAIPGAAYVAAILLEQFASSGLKGRSYHLIAVGCAYLVMFKSSMLFQYFEAALLVTYQKSLLQEVYFVSATINAILFCGGVVAVCIVVLHLLLELPVLWLRGATRLGVEYTFSALRPLSVVVGITLTFNLVLGLFVAELWPTTIASLVLGK